MPDLETIVSSQLTSLDDTDALASAWTEALEAATASNKLVWGGRGKGGRGLARRTYQRYDIVVENVRLEYVSQASPSLPSKLLLEGANLKLLSPHVYVLVGVNGVGKSTLLRRIASGKIPGFPPHISSMYIPQEVVCEPDRTSMDIVLRHHDMYLELSIAANQNRISELEDLMEGLDLTTEDDERQMQEFCEQISALEEESQGGRHDILRQQAEEALTFFGIDEDTWDIPSTELSGGHRKKVALACALVCQNDLLLLDEPTNFMDIEGLLQLRRLISICNERRTTVLMISHDVDLVNDVATDIIHMFGNDLHYYPGNYRDFIGYKAQRDIHSLRQNAALEKKRDAIMNSIDNLKKAPIPKRGGGKKKGKLIESRKKKLEKVGLEKDELGHRWTAQKAGSGIREGAINSVDASSRKKLTHTQLLKRVETNVAAVPDKTVQFVFRNPTSTWGEPVVMAMDIGYGYNLPNERAGSDNDDGILKKEGYLFDCVDLCIDEGSTVCILGANGTGKSSLLRLLAGVERPLEGIVHHPNNLSVGYFDQHIVDSILEVEASNYHHTPLSLLSLKNPKKTEQELRGELTSFGLSPQQATTNITFLSGGERCRLCLAALMLASPDLLIMDEPTSHLDVESVDALVYGLKNWTGTVVMVSHDANFVRSLEATCFVICQPEGKVLRVPKGIDFYLKSFKI